MAQTWTKLLYHIVFSTKDRRELIAPALQPNLHAYMGGIIKLIDELKTLLEEHEVEYDPKYLE